MDNFWSHYQSGHLKVGKNLIDRLGYDDEVVKFVFDPDSYYVPNRRNDSFVRPSTVSPDKIAVVGLDSDTEYRFGYSRIHPIQESRVAAADLSLDAIKNQLAGTPKTIRRSQKRDSSAGIIMNKVHLDNDLRLSDQPLMVLNFDSRSGPPEQICPGAILHELTHITQHLSEPIQPRDRNLQNELEAYAAQATLLYEVRVPYSTNTAMAATVDQFRKKNLGEHEYEPTRLFTEAFFNDPTIGHTASTH